MSEKIRGKKREIRGRLKPEQNGRKRAQKEKNQNVQENCNGGAVQEEPRNEDSLDSGGCEVGDNRAQKKTRTFRQNPKESRKKGEF